MRSGRKSYAESYAEWYAENLIRGTRYAEWSEKNVRLVDHIRAHIIFLIFQYSPSPLSFRCRKGSFVWQFPAMWNYTYLFYYSDVQIEQKLLQLDKAFDHIWREFAWNDTLICSVSYYSFKLEMCNWVNLYLYLNGGYLIQFHCLWLFFVSCDMQILPPLFLDWWSWIFFFTKLEFAIFQLKRRYYLVFKTGKPVKVV